MSAIFRVHWSTQRTQTRMQVHMARLVLLPDASASPALAHLFETCQRAACDAVAAEHAAAQSSATEVAVVQTVCACAHSSGSDVQVQVRVVFVGPVGHCPACTLRKRFALWNPRRQDHCELGESFSQTLWACMHMSSPQSNGVAGNIFSQI